MSHYRSLTVVSMKMYFRNKQGIFWALFFPFMIMIIFGLLDFGGFNAPDIGIDDRAGNSASRALIEKLRGPDGDDPIIEVSHGVESTLLAELDDGGVDAVFVIPEGFGEPGRRSAIRVTTDLRRPQESSVALVVLSDALEDLFFEELARELEAVPDRFLIESRFGIEQTTIEGQDQGFKGFLVPGIAAMAIMQSGIFGVVFTLVRFRAQGVLRRLYATPISPAHFLVGQVITRLTISVLQTYILLAVGAVALGVTIGGSPGAWLSMTLLALMGGALFLSLGLAISGMAKTEEVAAPVSNIIALPMMFLSGVFFPVDSLPDTVSRVTQYLPLTFLADGMRAAALEGAGVTSLGPEFLGLAVWTALMFAIATRTFRWE
ncbi:MAG: ABC transporter permease [Chloroflexi bacterium]|nr:ABC transporter permease [Chloroflexota bacterium]